MIMNKNYMPVSTPAAKRDLIIFIIISICIGGFIVWRLHFSSLLVIIPFMLSFFYRKMGKIPVARLSESNRLMTEYYIIDIDKITGIVDKGHNHGVDLSFFHIDGEERTTNIPVRNEDKRKLINDILNINPTIAPSD
jgi:hypothetical protein